ncbi:ATP-dependent zinc protease [Billgrantia saliphila]|uniref:retropepsin-like aspartic peptidase RloA3 n=1 Tax=Billgrantia saliphila TaxID=1848458 RepID=UPI000CE5017E|nr:ATP-dependent zinc protease [Halomonas saliphila]
MPQKGCGFGRAVRGRQWNLRGLVGGLLLAASLAQGAVADEKPVFGWVEKGTIEPWGVEVKAKLDSGALTSSLDARDIERFDKEGEEWVRFRLKLENEANGESFSEQLELPLYRSLKLRGAGGVDRRPVVLMKVCLGDTVFEEQFSLRDRGDMNYPLLLGRRTIGHLGLLDVRETFLTDPSCGEDAPLVEHDPDEDDAFDDVASTD